jgi:hypothetical protein
MMKKIKFLFAKGELRANLIEEALPLFHEISRGQPRRSWIESLAYLSPP